MKIELFLDIEPPTATSQENKTAFVNGRLMHYKSSAAKNTFRILSDNLKPFKPFKPMDGPIMLTAKWYFPKGKSHKDGEWRITKPDTDNLNKALKDVLERLEFVANDSRICSEHIYKYWSSEPGIEIILEELDDE